MTKSLAKFISILLGPHVWGPLLIVVSVFKSGLDQSRIILMLMILLMFQFVIPLGYLHWQRLQGKVSSWDLALRRERPKIMIVGLVSFSLSLVLIYFLGNQFLFQLTLILILVSLISLLITEFWKVSLHAELNAGGAILLNYLFDWKINWIYLTIPLIVWARYRLRRHTLPQLLIGVLVGGSFTVGLLKFFGYIS